MLGLIYKTKPNNNTVFKRLTALISRSMKKQNKQENTQKAYLRDTNETGRFLIFKFCNHKLTLEQGYVATGVHSTTTNK